MSNKEPQRINLDYAPPRRHWITRRRVAAVIILLVICGVAWKWGPQVWRQSNLLYLQSRCANYSSPADALVYRDSPWMPTALGDKALLLWRKYQPHVVYANSWDGVGAGPRLTRGDATPESLVFMHALTSRSGATRLVYVLFRVERRGDPGGERLYYDIRPLVIEMAGWNTQPRPLGKDITRVIPAGPSTRPGAVDVYAGQVDPKNPSRFNFRVYTGGVDLIIDGQLQNDDSVLIVPRTKLRAPTTRQ